MRKTPDLRAVTVTSLLELEIIETNSLYKDSISRELLHAFATYLASRDRLSEAGAFIVQDHRCRHHYLHHIATNPHPTSPLHLEVLRRANFRPG
jgi:hypothetical protein